MGGYGALKWALHQPERFAAAASLSGALDLDVLSRRRVAGSRCSSGSSTARSGPHDDLFALLDDADIESLPSVYVGCGTEDHLFAGNVRFVDEATRAGVDVHVDFRPGEHEWGMWDATIRDVLAWLPLAR